jgi:hypothetical protein
MREFVNVRTYWLQEQPADTAPTSE